MTNGAVALLRKRWASLIAWEAAMDYSAADYTNDRIGGLEREVEQLKDELRRTRMSAEAADGGFAKIRQLSQETQEPCQSASVSVTEEQAWGGTAARNGRSNQRRARNEPQP